MRECDSTNILKVMIYERKAIKIKMEGRKWDKILCKEKTTRIRKMKVEGSSKPVENRVTLENSYEVDRLEDCYFKCDPKTS